jgi:hypothetical protein
MYGPLEYFFIVGYIFPNFGKLYWEKSGNPAASPGSSFVVEVVSARLTQLTIFSSEAAIKISTIP